MRMNNKNKVSICVSVLINLPDSQRVVGLKLSWVLGSTSPKTPINQAGDGTLDFTEGSNASLLAKTRVPKRRHIYF